MEISFADRMSQVPRSFIREILKVTQETDVISFAGGLPNPDFFPIAELEASTQKVFQTKGSNSLQYSNSEGYIGLRRLIAQRYKDVKGLDISPEEILITTGSQQALDLLGKILLNEKDEVIIEEPGYLGAIQAFSLYRPVFLPVSLTHDGMDPELLKRVMDTHRPKLIYTVPNFQNPSGISYSTETREKVTEILRNSGTLLVEDDPYGELRFEGTPHPSFKSLLPEQTLLLGSFSKTVVPSFRIGWIVAPGVIMEKLIIAKQAADLHTNFFCQQVIAQYLTDFDNRKHIRTICSAYGKQKNAMIAAIHRYFPKEVTCTYPEGGMFLWITLPEGLSAMKLFALASKRKVYFVPGDQFYTRTQGEVNTLRLNFSCVNEETIEKGIRLLAEAIEELMTDDK